MAGGRLVDGLAAGTLGRLALASSTRDAGRAHRRTPASAPHARALAPRLTLAAVPPPPAAPAAPQRYSRGIRQALYKLAKHKSWAERHKIVIASDDSEANGTYSSWLARSTFCFVLPGQAPALP